MHITSGTIVLVIVFIGQILQSQTFVLFIFRFKNPTVNQLTIMLRYVGSRASESI